MLYANIVQEFYSLPSNTSKPTSKYFVCEDGTVRAKVAAKEVYSRNYNICFVDQEARDQFGAGYRGFSAVYAAGIVRMTWTKNGADNIEVVGKTAHDATHNRVYEFDCDDNGLIGNKHMGSKITDAYDAKDSGISLAEIERVSAEFMDDGKTRVTRTGNADLTSD